MPPPRRDASTTSPWICAQGSISREYRAETWIQPTASPPSSATSTASSGRDARSRSRASTSSGRVGYPSWVVRSASFGTSAGAAGRMVMDSTLPRRSAPTRDQDWAAAASEGLQGLQRLQRHQGSTGTGFLSLESLLSLLSLESLF